MRLSDITYKDLPSYEIGLEQGIQKGEIRGKLQTAIMMIKTFKLPINEVAKKLNIDENELSNALYKKV